MASSDEVWHNPFYNSRSMTLPLALESRDPLCEGRYDEWLIKISALLRQHGLHAIINSISGKAAPPGYTELQQSYLAARLIQNSVKPHFLERISPQTRRRPLELLDVLRKHAKPFRFMDLPAELRLRVYDLVPDLQSQKIQVKAKTPARKIITEPTPKPRRKGKSRSKQAASEKKQSEAVPIEDQLGTHPIPGVTQATRQLRSETRSIFFSNGTFVFRWACSWGWVPPEEQSMMRAWMRDVVHRDSQHLRTIQVDRLRFTFAKDVGVTFEILGEEQKPVSDGFRKELRLEIEGVNASMDPEVGGRVLVDMLLSGMEIWNE